jgi:hypothetical protein
MQSTMSCVFLICLLGGTSLSVSLIATRSLDILYNIKSCILPPVFQCPPLESAKYVVYACHALVFIADKSSSSSLNHFQTMYVF